MGRSRWRMQGFIEAADGSLRPQSVEETTACIGCHGGVGSSTGSSVRFEGLEHVRVRP